MKTHVSENSLQPSLKAITKYYQLNQGRKITACCHERKFKKNDLLKFKVGQTLLYIFLMLGVCQEYREHVRVNTA
jgi:hypothetical protein